MDGSRITAQIVVDDPDNPDERALAMAEKARKGGIRFEFVRPRSTLTFIGEPEEPESEEDEDEEEHRRS